MLKLFYNTKHITYQIRHIKMDCSLHTIGLDPPAGTRDFPPSKMRIRNWLFDIWKDVSRKFGFQEYDCPVLEYQSLYTRKGGDDITQEMFAFDLHNNKLTLRPEMTPSVSRLIMKHYTTEPPPFKWFSIPQCWRYEDIKRGRKREHYQWNVDIFGAERVTSEIEVFLIIISFFKRIGLTSDDVVLKVSNRMILQKVLNKMNVKENLFERTCVLIDKIAKLPQEELSQKLTEEVGLSNENINVIYDLCKADSIDKIAKFLGTEDDIYLEMKQIFSIAEKIGITSWLQFDASIVRGLSYYTGIVFEGFSKNLPNLQKSLCGGGRYDDLLTKYGYKDKVPAIGFGFGDVVIIELLKDMKTLPSFPNKTEYLIVPFNMSLYPDALQVSEKFQIKGYNTEIYTKNTKIAKAYDYADRKGIGIVVLIAPDEWKENKIVVKRLRDDSITKQQTIKIEKFLKS